MTICARCTNASLSRRSCFVRTQKKKISSLHTRVAAIKTANGLNESSFFHTAWLPPLAGLDLQQQNLKLLSNYLCAQKELFSVWCIHGNRHGRTNQIQTRVSLNWRCRQMGMWVRRLTNGRARFEPSAPTSPSGGVLCIRLEPIYLFTLPQSQTPVVWCLLFTQRSNNAIHAVSMNPFTLDLFGRAKKKHTLIQP